MLRGNVLDPNLADLAAVLTEEFAHPFSSFPPQQLLKH